VKQIELGIEDIIELAVSSWRISKWNENNKIEFKMNTLPLEYSIRKIYTVLGLVNVEIIDPTGSYYDIGLAVDVVYSIDEDMNVEGKIIIHETLSPIILIDNKIVKRGEVVIKKK